MTYLSLHCNQVHAFLEKPDAVVLDTRDPVSFEREHLPGALPATDTSIRRLIKARQPDRPILVYCYHGNSSRDLCQLLTGFGLTQVYNLEGGWAAYAGHRDALDTGVSNPLADWLRAEGFDTANLNGRIANGMTALMVAAKQARPDIVDALLQAGCDPDLLNSDLNPALWFACVASDTGIIRRLVDNGADLDNQNVNGATCLIYAASSGKLDIVRTLVELGADTGRQTLDGFNALDSASTLPVLRFLKSRYSACA